MKAEIKEFQYLEIDSLQALKARFYAHFEYLDHKAYLDVAWALFVSDGERYATFAAGGWVEIADADYQISLNQETGAIVWSYTDKSLDEQWGRTMDDDVERERTERYLIQDALGYKAMLNVAPMFDECGKHKGFQITLRASKGSSFKAFLFSDFAEGGLKTQSGTNLLAPYEFSMHRYANCLNNRAATEYVRRKLHQMYISTTAVLWGV